MLQLILKVCQLQGKQVRSKTSAKANLGEGKVHAKSGSINGIKAYAGYVDAPNGHQIAFAIIANDYKLSGSAMAKKMEPFFNQLATYRAQPE